MGRGVARDGDVKEDRSKVMKNCLDLVFSFGSGENLSEVKVNKRESVRFMF